MKSSIHPHSNENYRIKAQPSFLSYEPGFHQTGYTNPEKTQKTKDLHSYIVDWQITSEVKKANS